MLLDVAYTLVTEGMTLEQRDEFTNDLRDADTGGDAEEARRRAYALHYGEQ